MSAGANPRGLRVWRGADGALVLEVDGRSLDLSSWLAARGDGRGVVELAAEGFFGAAALERALGDGPWDEAPRPDPVACPVDPGRVGKILALGKNFREHAAEFGEDVPDEPLFFNKLPETLVPHGATVAVPDWYDGRVDHEAELALVVGRRGRDVEPERAFEHVAGYTVANDLTARSLQGADRAKKYPWFRAKNLDGFCPLGPCFVPRDALDVSDLRVTARVFERGGEGALRQDARTSRLVVGVPAALAWLSKHLTLRPGDLVLLGTPAGVGPLGDGDRVVCAVEGIGELETTIARPAGRP